MIKLRPSERMILLALAIRNGQNITQLSEMLSIRQDHVYGSMRILTTAGLVVKDESVTPPTYHLPVSPIEESSNV